ncbi:MAG: M64 family metallo-endopeptidase, partial [Proteobacteria bacterium]|nr:M64 family metallo-endopeptidase [Pseudomonadota bacterium]
MKRTKLIFIIVLIFQALVCLPCSAQDIIEKVINNGEDTSRFVWVFLAEGYTESELQKYKDDSKRIINYFISSSPWNEYRSFINIYTIFTPSNQSGADHPSQNTYVDTAFDATFDSYGIDNLLTVNDAKAFNAAAQVPAFDAVFILVNDEQNGGSGGATVVISNGPAAAEIALHEAGHLIAHLSDEYETPYPISQELEGMPNITGETETEAIPWKDWIDPETPLPTPETITDRIGLFEGAGYSATGIYRPKHNCKMRELGVQYCEICSEALIRNIYNFVSPIDKFGPEESEITVTGKAVLLWIEPTPVIDSAYEVTWELDGRIVNNHSDMSYTVNPSTLDNGMHTICVWLRDKTPLVRKDTEGHLTAQHTWMVNKLECSGKVSGTIRNADNKHGIADAAITLLPSSDIMHTDNDGVFQFENLSCGIYTIVVNAPGFEEAEKEFSITGDGETILDIVLTKKGPLYSVSGSILGRVREGVTIKLYGKVSSKLQTNAGGIFTFPSLPPGNYIIIPEAPGCSFFPHSQTVTIQETN